MEEGNNLARFPTFTYKTRMLGEWVEVDLGEAMRHDGYSVIFGLPGAFTPTCSNHQLPDYDTLVPEFRTCGVNNVYCTAVNDPFVMNAWFNDQQVENVIPVPDGNGTLALDLGMLVSKDNLNFGQRSWRYAMVIDGRTQTVVKEFVEDGLDNNIETDPYEVSDPTTVLTWCKQNLQG